MKSLLEFNEAAKAKYPEWENAFTYMHWCDLINLDPDMAINSSTVLAYLDGNIILMFFRENRLMTVYNVDTDDLDSTFISIAATLKILAEKTKAGDIPRAVKAASKKFAEVTGIKFDTKATIVNLVLAPTQPHLMLNTYTTLFVDEETRNENLRVKTTATSKNNYRREVLRKLNPIIKESNMRFITLDYKDPAARFNSQQILVAKVNDDTRAPMKGKQSYFHVFTFDTVKNTVKVFDTSPLFSTIHRVDRAEFTYKEFTEILVEVRNSITSWLVMRGLEPNDKNINMAILYLGSFMTREGVVFRPHLTEQEVVIFLENGFDIDQVFRSVMLNIPVKDLASFKDAPDEWLDMMVNENESDTIAHFGQLMTYYF